MDNLITLYSRCSTCGDLISHLHTDFGDNAVWANYHCDKCGYWNKKPYDIIEPPLDIGHKIGNRIQAARLSLSLKLLKLALLVGDPKRDHFVRYRMQDIVSKI